MGEEIRKEWEGRGGEGGCEKGVEWERKGEGGREEEGGERKGEGGREEEGGE